MTGVVFAPSHAARLRFALSLARRLMRSRTLAWSTSILLVTGMFVLTMFITLGTLSLSGDQVADRDLGRFGASVGYGSIGLPPGDDQFLPSLRAQLAGVGVSDSQVLLSTSSLQLATTPPRDVSMVEADWSSQPFPHRYRLLSGRWPTGPGEVVVTEPHDMPTDAGGTLPVLGGEVVWRVVGIADDRFSSTSNLLAGPGTWASVDPRLAEGFPLLRAQPVLLWSGEGPDDVLTAFSAAVRE